MILNLKTTNLRVGGSNPSERAKIPARPGLAGFFVYAGCLAVPLAAGRDE
jgi:hypothetical protein